MRKNLLSSLALILIGLAAGVGIGRITSAHRSPAANPVVSLPATKTGPKVLPAVESQPKSAQAEKLPGKKLPLAEVEAAIQAALKKGVAHRSEAFNEIVQSIEPADIPQVLSIVEKIPGVQARVELRQLLL